jgi:hypothetical protein
MKRNGILILMAITLVMSACKKKGCTDPAATNYSAEAEKDDGTCTYASATGVEGAIELTSNIDVPTTLVAGTYKICFALKVNSQLTLSPGCTLIMCENSSITVKSSGYFNATGTAAEKIIIKGEVETKGYWQGIAFESTNPNNKLIHTRVSDAGTYWAWEFANVFVTGQLNISESIISNSENVGLFLGNAGSFSNFSMNTFSNNTVGLSLNSSQVKNLDSETIYNQNNTNDYIDARSGTISTSSVWKALNTPLLIHSLDVTAALSLDAGSNIKVEADGKIEVKTTGSISSNGTATAPVFIQGRYNTPAFWLGIQIVSNNPNNKMTYTLIGDGGKYWAYEFANIQVKGRLDISNSIIQNSNSYGIYVNSTGSVFANGVSTPNATQVEANNTFISNGTGPDANCTTGCTVFFY